MGGLVPEDQPMEPPKSFRWLDHPNDSTAVYWALDALYDRAPITFVDAWKLRCTEGSLPFFVQASVGCKRLTARFPWLPELYGIVETRDFMYIVSEYLPISLGFVLTTCPERIFLNEPGLRFMVYQLVSAVVDLQDLSIPYGTLRPATIFLTDSLWVRLLPFPTKPVDTEPIESAAQTATAKWCAGELSNYDYLMYLNILSGRQRGNPAFHPVFPWVHDLKFKEKPMNISAVTTGFRNLRESKFRLSKGDEMLDMTYTGQTPHHLVEPLSDLTYFIYNARQMDVNVLRKYVRHNFEPKEYPSSIARMYQWTPDECIPEFYDDPKVFTSVHENMADLEIPPWAESKEDFVRVHRELLESDAVSAMLHHWIDLVFGFKLSGTAAANAKNVILQHARTQFKVQNRTNMKLVDIFESSTGFFRQLFTMPHPMKLSLLSRNDTWQLFHEETEEETEEESAEELSPREKTPPKTQQSTPTAVPNTAARGVVPPAPRETGDDSKEEEFDDWEFADSEDAHGGDDPAPGGAAAAAAVVEAADGSANDTVCVVVCPLKGVLLEAEILICFYFLHSRPPAVRRRRTRRFVPHLRF